MPWRSLFHVKHRAVIIPVLSMPDAGDRVRQKPLRRFRLHGEDALVGVPLVNIALWIQGVPYSLTQAATPRLCHRQVGVLPQRLETLESGPGMPPA